VVSFSVTKLRPGLVTSTSALSILTFLPRNRMSMNDTVIIAHLWSNVTIWSNLLATIDEMVQSLAYFA
jgi:hypothetical protein